jgi:hypothetical protein
MIVYFAYLIIANHSYSRPGGGTSVLPFILNELFFSLFNTFVYYLNVDMFLFCYCLYLGVEKRALSRRIMLTLPAIQLLLIFCIVGMKYAKLKTDLRYHDIYLPKGDNIHSFFEYLYQLPKIYFHKYPGTHNSPKGGLHRNKAFAKYLPLFNLKLFFSCIATILAAGWYLLKAKRSVSGTRSSAASLLP